LRIRRVSFDNEVEPSLSDVWGLLLQKIFQFHSVNRRYHLGVDL
jgi:hypothetical protein